MSAGGPWSVKGIDPRARARAKTAARKEGVTLGEWLNRVIMDDSTPGQPVWDDALEGFPGFSGGAANDEEDRLLRAMINRLAQRIQDNETASSKTLSDLDRAINQLASSVMRSTEKQSAKLAERDETAKSLAGQQAAIADRLRSLESKLESGSGGNTKAVEAAVMKLARRLYEHENDIAARLHEQDEARAEAEHQRQRLETLEHRANGLAEFAQRVENSERGTNDTTRTLETAFARLDERLRALETRNSSDTVELERRFDRMSDDVARIIGDIKSEQASNTGRIDETERRQADSLSRLGDEISRLAQAIDQRLSESERRAETARRDRRSEEALNSRIDTVRQENRENMRRMGEEVTRLGRSLAERISRSEEQSAHAVEAATSKMTEALERFEKTQPEREAELDQRLRDSEERTVQRIETALGGVQVKLEAVKADTEDALSPVQRAMTALADRLEKIEQRGSTPSRPARRTSSVPQGTTEVAAEEISRPLGPPPQAEVPTSQFDAGKTDPFLAAPGPAAPAQPAPVQTSVQAASAPRMRQPQPAPAAHTLTQPAMTPAQGASADGDFLAAARERTRTAQPSPYERENRSGRFSRATLIAIPLVALTMLAGAGTILVWDAIQGNPQQTIADSGGRDFAAQIEAGLADPAAPAPQRQAQATQGAAAETSPPPQTSAVPVEASTVTDAPAEPPRNMVADAGATIMPSTSETATETRREEPAPAARTSTPPQQRSTRTTLESAALDGNAVARYQLGLQLLEGGDAASAAALLLASAEQGVPAAQYRYAKLLETGEGVEIDLEAARRWTERAANAGHRRAMHNLAVMHYYGTGTARDFETAARWFQEAALMGLRDSQFNLALLFESGQGVPLSLADAFTWFLISASENDPTAAERARLLQAQLPPEAVTEARGIAAGFTPRPIDAEANGLYQNQPWDRTISAASEDVERAQGFLSVLGYTPGPIDGMIGAQTREAIMAFEAAQGLPRTGRVDAVLLDRLERAVSG
ncbi:peptidoglycan-binding protein [Maricaulis sp.]|uniref:peptidoglycan-binding protein n=1 Tax=Maricaulis sp. TaxID=1486257 RepID=UPI00262F7E2C|nr:peptidoglycan-binding protein [Maricaulis sp.]